MSEVGVQKRLAMVVVIGLISLTAGCTFSYPVDRDYLVPDRYPPKPVDYPVRVYSEKPKCPYEEIVLLTINGGTRDENIELMVGETREVGGDAIFIVHVWSPEYPSPDAYILFSTGLVLRWLQEDCRE